MAKFKVSLRPKVGSNKGRWQTIWIDGDHIQDVEDRANSQYGNDYDVHVFLNEREPMRSMQINDVVTEEMDASSAQVLAGALGAVVAGAAVIGLALVVGPLGAGLLAFLGVLAAVVVKGNK